MTQPLPAADVALAAGLSADRSAGAPAPDPRLEDYLDRVCAPLVEVVPHARRQELRAELQSHLEALVASYQELGEDPEVAVLSALRQFGDPRTLGERWAREWSQHADRRPHPPWEATRIGLARFGAATVIAFSQYGLLHLIEMAEPRALSSQILLQALLLVMLEIAIGLPICAGYLTGKAAKDRPALGAFLALSGCTVVSGLVSLLAPLLSLGLPAFPELVVCQALLWMPLGCGAAAFSQWLHGRLEARPRPWLAQ
jgi:hypothetical protein